MYIKSSKLFSFLSLVLIKYSVCDSEASGVSNIFQSTLLPNYQF